MTKKCIQCNKPFNISDSEIQFYESKNLSLPKRCKECREKNKNAGSSGKAKRPAQTYKSYYAKKDNSSALGVVILAVITAIVGFILKNNALAIGASLFTVVAIVKYILDLKNSNVFIQEFNTAPYKYTFYNTDSMVKHYVKHGDETNCSSMEDYLYKANLVIIDKGNLSKLQKKDGDQIYYNTKTKEIVVVAKAGYVRTYFIASDKYYNKQ